MKKPKLQKRQCETLFYHNMVYDMVFISKYCEKLKRKVDVDAIIIF